MNATALTSLAFADPREWTAGKLAARFPALPAETTCGAVYEWFGTAPNQPAIALLDERGNVAGLVNRLLFLSRYAQRFYPELYARRSILNLANKRPLIVDAAVSIAELGATLALEKPDAQVEIAFRLRARRGTRPRVRRMEEHCIAAH